MNDKAKSNVGINSFFNQQNKKKMLYLQTNFQSLLLLNWSLTTKIPV